MTRNDLGRRLGGALSIALLALIPLGTALAGQTGPKDGADKRITRSLDGYKQDISDAQRQTLPDETAITVKSALSASSEQQLNTLGDDAQLAQKQPGTLGSLDTGFSIFDATTLLIYDDDHDGYYHHFSLSFDADVDYGSADVYAEVFISYEGGPWNHFATTRVFTIHGQSTLDEYEIVNELVSGYPAGLYDVHIDLYDAYTDELLAVRDELDDADLINLPLEDAERDAPYYDDYDYDYGSGGGGCTLGTPGAPDPLLPVLALLALLYVTARRLTRRRAKALPKP